MTLSLTKRGCDIGGSLNGRTEMHGDDPVGAIDVTLSGIMLEPEELDALLGEGSYGRLFNIAGQLPEPAFKTVKHVAIGTKYEGSNVAFVLGVDETELELGNVKLAKITLSPQTGGLTEMSLQVQANPEPAQAALLYLNMSQSASVAIRFGKEQSKKKAQPELPLQHTQSNPEPESAPTEEAVDA